MIKIVGAVVLALAIAAPPALARTMSSNITIPSAQNSGVGIHALAGTEGGPAAQLGTIGSAAAPSRYSMSLAEQDASRIPGLPGTEAGPSVLKLPSHLG
ncbi:hypothetical protein [Bradyrhizobium sp. STM 3562]|uniref:hypothetical protein n=1 Tax=Bradyrhizobium sp. STM 3562 TaxID=578924 RepID=UPI00388E9063